MTDPALIIIPTYNERNNLAPLAAACGVPMGMLFVRNRNGSHNPHAALEIEDFLAATTLLTQWLADDCCR